MNVPPPDIQLGEDKAMTHKITKDEYGNVATKLNAIMVSGMYGMDEVRYIFDWDESLSSEVNLQHVEREDVILRFFLDIGVINGLHIDNGYRRDEIEARRQDAAARVWADWDAADSAYKEYDKVVLIHGVNGKLLRKESEELGLEAGLSLFLEDLPAVICSIGDFAVHDSNIISYQGAAIPLEGQVAKIASFIMTNTKEGLITSRDSLIDNCLSEQYLSANSGDDEKIYRYLQRYISDARSKFKAASRSTRNNFVNKPSTGYTFKP